MLERDKQKKRFTWTGLTNRMDLEQAAAGCLFAAAYACIDTSQPDPVANYNYFLQAQHQRSWRTLHDACMVRNAAYHRGTLNSLSSAEQRRLLHL